MSATGPPPPSDGAALQLPHAVQEEVLALLATSVEVLTGLRVENLGAEPLLARVHGQCCQQVAAPGRRLLAHPAEEHAQQTTHCL
eukprot:CAMPEP_0179195616 /NCGR_PEP_ID=MMETSP0796-20121207/97242_1 /TAXON_ID=73915 /ORGANISM="Pyrodinium bahamense, Strain pbaha01" /LENGTH=84 /DNA_ID=CAMNT_0020899973 /DNA_START=120 /DNA_END=372 /DNA_ORIENTATION=-